MNRSWRSRAWQIGLALAGIALFLFTLRAVSLHAVWMVLSRLTLQDLLLLSLANLLVLLAFAGRWWVFLWGLGYRVPYGKLFGYRLAAFGVSYFTPGPHFGGEPVQVYLVTEQQQVPADSSIAAVTLDKIFELLSNFTFLFLGLLFVLQTGLLSSVAPGATVGNQMLLYALLLVLLPGALLAAIWLGYHPLSGLLLVLTARWPSPTLRRWYDTLQQSEAQVASLCRERPSVLFAAILISAVSWVLLVGEYWLMTQLLGLHLSFGQAIVALIAARLAILLPMPAGLGALEASQAIAMSMLGLDPAAGVSLALLIRARDVLLGLLGLWIGGATAWRIAAEKAEEIEDETSSPAQQREQTAWLR